MPSRRDPGKARRDPGRTRRLLLDAGTSVMTDHYLASDRTRPPLPITVSEVLQRVHEPAADGGEARQELTTGAVTAAFGSRVALLEAIAVEIIAPDVIMGELKAFITRLREEIDNPDEARHEIAAHDLLNMTGSLALTRHWFAAHSQAANPEIARQLRAVYEGLDELLVPVYQLIGAKSRRQPRSGLTWRHVAAAFTAWTEGLTMRFAYQTDGSREAPWQSFEEAQPFFMAGAEALWVGLTEPET